MTEPIGAPTRLAHGDPRRPDVEKYAVSLAVPRVSSPRLLTHALFVTGFGLALTLMFFYGEETWAQIAAAAWLGLCGATLIALRTPTKTIGVGLSERTLTMHSGDVRRQIPLDSIARVRLSELPYAGENVDDAGFLIKGQHTLSVTDVSGQTYRSAIDYSNPFGKRIVNALREGKAPISPWHGYQEAEAALAAKSAKAAQKAKTVDASSATKASNSPAATGQSYEALWNESVRAHDRVLQQYGAYELDPQLLLKYPAIVDVTADASADFFHALSEAGALRTEAFPGPGDHCDAYRDAVRELVKAWAKAEKNAKSVGITLLSDPDQRRISQAAKLLKHAEGATTPLERATYLNQARVLIDNLIESGAITPPPAMVFEIAKAAAAALEAGS